MMNESIVTPIEELIEKAGEYGKTSIELLKLKAIDKKPCNKKYFVYNREVYSLSFLLWYHSIGLGLSLLQWGYLLSEISGLDRSSEKHG